MMLPIPLPVPAAVCKFTSTGLFVACENPSAIPTTDASCKPSTYFHYNLEQKMQSNWYEEFFHCIALDLWRKAGDDASRSLFSKNAGAFSEWTYRPDSEPISIKPLNCGFIFSGLLSHVVLIE